MLNKSGFKIYSIYIRVKDYLPIKDQTHCSMVCITGVFFKSNELPIILANANQLGVMM